MNRQKVTSGFAGNLIGASIASFIAVIWLFLAVSTGHCEDKVQLRVSPKISSLGMRPKTVTLTVIIKDSKYFCDAYLVDWADGSRSFHEEDGCDPLATDRQSFVLKHTYTSVNDFEVAVYFMRQVDEKKVRIAKFTTLVKITE